jgi:hypothetical protein
MQTPYIARRVVGTAKSQKLIKENTNFTRINQSFQRLNT